MKKAIDYWGKVNKHMEISKYKYQGNNPWIWLRKPKCLAGTKVLQSLEI